MALFEKGKPEEKDLSHASKKRRDSRNLQSHCEEKQHSILTCWVWNVWENAKWLLFVASVRYCHGGNGELSDTGRGAVSGRKWQINQMWEPETEGRG